MKKIMLGAVALFAIGAAPALAADLPAQTYTKAPTVVPAPVYNWTGFYIGGNAGWAGSASNNIYNTGTDNGGAGLGSALAVGAIPTSLSQGYSGFIGGGQVGYNWQVGSLVYGLEADIDGLSAKGSTTAFFPGAGGGAAFSTNFNRELDWLATFRGRIGFTAAPSLLLYGTGGLAVGQTKIGNSFICATCGPPAFTEPSTVNQTSNTSAGWTVGAGAQWMFAPQWSVKAEYLYVDLGRHNSTITYTYAAPGAFTSTLTSTARDTENIVRVGVNYKFGGQVVAKY
jgi:outer membrane immunogenic protein